MNLQNPVVHERHEKHEQILTNTTISRLTRWESRQICVTNWLIS